MHWWGWVGSSIIILFILGVFSQNVWQASWQGFQRRYFQTNFPSSSIFFFYVFHFTITHKGQELPCNLTAFTEDVIGNLRITVWNYLLFSEILFWTEASPSLTKPVFSPRPVFLETWIFHPRVPIAFPHTHAYIPSKPHRFIREYGTFFFFLAIAIFKFVTCDLWYLN